MGSGTDSFRMSASSLSISFSQFSFVRISPTLAVAVEIFRCAETPYRCDDGHGGSGERGGKYVKYSDAAANCCPMAARDYIVCGEIRVSL